MIFVKIFEIIDSTLILNTVHVIRRDFVYQKQYSDNTVNIHDIMLTNELVF